MKLIELDQRVVRVDISLHQVLDQLVFNNQGHICFLLQSLKFDPTNEFPPQVILIN